MADQYQVKLYAEVEGTDMSVVETIAAEADSPQEAILVALGKATIPIGAQLGFSEKALLRVMARRATNLLKEFAR